MTRAELRERLRAEVLRWEQEGFRDLAALSYPVTYAIGAPNDPAFYQTEVTLLEKTPEYIHLAGGGLGRRRQCLRPHRRGGDGARHRTGVAGARPWSVSQNHPRPAAPGTPGTA